ncbi:MAG: class II aldolase/adducin family protein [Deltaproteobacteria bacterium]|nr:class II aldolase/adducin family protein [Deltaproteobacteria bacterium]
MKQKSASIQQTQLKRDILVACKILDNEGLVKGFGHVSARAPGNEGRIFITPRRALRLVKTADDLAMVDLNGAIARGKAEPPLEHQLHLAIYKKRPEIGAICRAHGPYTYVFGIVEKPVKAIHGWSALVGESVSVHSNPHLVKSPVLATEAAEALGDRDALILRGNGSVTVGRTVHEAVVKSLFLEETAELLYRAAQLGEPVYISGEEQRRRAVADEQEYIRAWNYYKSKIASS